jgi:hypothetical protein
MVGTLENPNSISAGASGQRMNAALAASVLEPAVNAAVSAQAENSLEKMLCHQMAGAHFTGAQQSGSGGAVGCMAGRAPDREQPRASSEAGGRDGSTASTRVRPEPFLR